MKVGILAVVALTLGGCGLVQSVSTPPPPPDVAGALNATYATGPVQNMLTRYGAPLRQMPSGNAVIYSWERSRVMYFGTQPPLPVTCQMDAYVSPAGVVTAVNVSGQMGACVMFM